MRKYKLILGPTFDSYWFSSRAKSRLGPLSKGIKMATVDFCPRSLVKN